MLHEMIVMLNDSRVLIVRVDAARMAVSSDDSCRCSMERLEHLCKGRKGRTKEFYISQLIYPVVMWSSSTIFLLRKNPPEKKEEGGENNDDCSSNLSVNLLCQYFSHINIGGKSLYISHII